MLVCVAAACARNDETQPEARPTELHLLTAHLPQPGRAALDGGGNYLWEKGDALAVWDGASRYSLQASEGGSASADFPCDLPAAGVRYAFFPDDPDAAFGAAGRLTASLPTLQTPSAGGFDRRAPLLLARSADSDFALQAVCGFLRFTISSPGIASVQLRGNRGEALSGQLSAGFDEAGRAVCSVVQACDHVTLLPALGDSFVPGEYWLATLPASLENGYNLSFTRTSDDLSASFQQAAPARIPQGGVLDAGVVDRTLVWSRDEDATLAVPFLIGLSGASLSWPFQEQLPSGTTTASPAYGGIPTVFHLREGVGTGAFEICASTGIAHVSSSSEGLKILGDAGDYILLPAREGMYLAAVTLRAGGAGILRSPCITSADGNDVVGGGASIPVRFSQAGEEWTWRLRGTRPGERYRISFPVPGHYSPGADYSARIQELRLSYSRYPLENPPGEEEPAAAPRDTVPDFSRVGYHAGDRPLPVYPVVRTLSPPQNGEDATALIQEAIDGMTGTGAILLKAGVWNVEGLIYLDRSGVVLRGEGENTIIRACGTRGYKLNDTVIRLGHRSSDRVLDRSSATPLVEDASCGQFWVRVQNPLPFRAGDRVVVYRRPTQEWISAIRMDPFGWDPNSFNLYWERTVEEVDGDRIRLDNPLVMSVTAAFGGGSLIKCSWDRVSESGVEKLCFDSVYDDTLYDETSLYALRWGRYLCDEDHAWYAISVQAAENCWITDVQATHFAGGLASLLNGSRNITVEHCASHHPVSAISGSRRYAFHFHKCETCLVRDCTADMDRHAFVTGFGCPGPNVFSRCTATNMYEDVGPHHHWATGTLYDLVQSDFNITVQDRADAGDGHGWAGANFVLWNCDIIARTDGNSRSGRLVCQNPWASARNWAFGCGPQEAIVNTTRTYTDGLVRPDGEIISPGTHMEHASLYEWQLEQRRVGQ